MGTSTSKFDLSMIIGEEDGLYNINLEYRTKLFHSDSIRQLLNCYITLIQSVLNNQNETINKLRFLILIINNYC